LSKQFNKSWFYVAAQYVQASMNLLDGMINTGNRKIAISDHEMSDDEVNEQLRYSSQSIILPALFCLYQGIELILKGFVSYKSDHKPTHSFEKLLTQFLTHYDTECALSELFFKLIKSPVEFIAQYKDTNKIKDMGSLYNTLRYPDMNKKNVNYDLLLHFDNQKFMFQVRGLGIDINRLLTLSVELFRKLEDSQ